MKIFKLGFRRLFKFFLGAIQEVDGPEQIIAVLGAVDHFCHVFLGKIHVGGNHRRSADPSP